jgi:hypothetical protein
MTSDLYLCLLPADRDWPGRLLHQLATHRRSTLLVLPEQGSGRYPPDVSSDVWVGAVTTLIGAALGGTISFVLSRQQLNDARLQRNEAAEREQHRRSEDRRFQAYSDFLNRVRSCRNALQAYYLHADNRPFLDEIDVILRAANDAPAMVFLLVETDETYEACRAVLRALWKTQKIIHGIEPSRLDDPWSEINNELESATREFQIAVRKELGVTGPMRPWVPYYEKSNPEILTTEVKDEGSSDQERTV